MRTTQVATGKESHMFMWSTSTGETGRRRSSPTSPPRGRCRRSRTTARSSLRHSIPRRCRGGSGERAPGTASSGTLLLTVPCMGKVDHESPTSDYWRWMPAGLKLVLERSFPGDRVLVEGHGNVLACAASLMGLAQEELREDESYARRPEFSTCRVRSDGRAGVSRSARPTGTDADGYSPRHPIT